MDLEALPVVGQPAGEKDLPGQEALPWFLMARLRLLHLGALLGGQLVAKRAADMTEQRDGRPLEVPPVRLARRLRGGTALALAQVDHQLEPRQLHRLDDPLAELRFDPLDEAAGVVMLVREGAGRRARAHEPPRSRPSPSPKGSRATPTSAWKRARSVTFSSSSIRSAPC